MKRVSKVLITKIKNLTKVFLFVVLGKLDPRKKKQFKILKMTEMLTITTKYKNFEIITSQMVDSMKYRFSKELSSHKVHAKTVDLVSKKDIDIIATRIIYSLFNLIAVSTDNYQYLLKKYLTPSAPKDLSSKEEDINETRSGFQFSNLSSIFKFGS